MRESLKMEFYHISQDTGTEQLQLARNLVPLGGRFSSAPSSKCSSALYASEASFAEVKFSIQV